MEHARLFEVDSYLDFLNQKIDENHTTRGYQTRLSNAAGCQPSYLTHVLKGRAHLTPDQATLLCEYWGFDIQETEYFLNLVHYARAVTKTLKSFISKKLSSLISDRQKIAKRIKVDKESIPEDKLRIYYSAWYYSAIHMAFNLEKLNSETKVAEILELPVGLVQEVAQLFLEWGFLEKNQQGLHAKPINFHLPKSSPFFYKHHYHWRNKLAAIDTLKSSEELHYTSIFTVSKSDYGRIKEVLMKTLEEMRETVSESRKEEELAYVTMDFGNFK